MLSVVYKKNARSGEMTEACILKILCYFSIFQYPLTRTEIKGYMPPGCSDVQPVLTQLLSRGTIFCINDFYLLTDDPALVVRRLAGNARASRMLPKAARIGRFLFRFPYVRGIAISGSLSKNFADDNADIDYFIVTAKDRLWIARTFMHLFKKLTFLAGKQHDYCMNYYIDESALLLEYQNIYTAIETTTLLPVCGEGMDQFFIANNWVQAWFSGYGAQNNVQPAPTSWFKRVSEWMFNNKAGEALDSYLMRLTTARWTRKKRKHTQGGPQKPMDLVTGKHFARSNPGMFQERLLSTYERKISDLRKDLVRDQPSGEKY